jgi:glycosyltransferase involved in cell wall biosynthesis
MAEGISEHVKMTRLGRIFQSSAGSSDFENVTARGSVERPSLSVVIPVYNEAENIETLVAKLSSALHERAGEVEILFVNDGSTDGTLAILRQLQKSDARIRIAHFRRNHGQTAAMAAGFRVARGQTVITMDGDLQNDPAEIPRLVEMLSEWDCVCGIRTRRQDSLWKRISSRIGNGFRNWATGDNIVDTGCTLKAFRRECLDRLELYKGMHRFLPTLLKMRGFRVTQVPVSHHPRLRGKTKYGTWGRLTKGLADVWAVRWMKKNRLNYEPDLEIIEHSGPEISPESLRERAAV